MRRENEAKNRRSTLRVDNQPPEVRELLTSIDAAARQANLYGSDHPSTAESSQHLSHVVREFTAVHERPTCVFTDEGVVVNERLFAPDAHSTEIAQRLRARGVMAITLTSQPAPQHLSAFLAFLYADPTAVRRSGGAAAYLRAAGVSSVVVTESIYNAGETEDDARTDTTDEGESAPSIDRAVAAAIDWLSRQEGENEGSAPRLPIARLLSDPDAAAKIIREAVTKLHASRRGKTQAELASEVVRDLRDMTACDTAAWDAAAPGIRKAIAKLPREMRPAVTGFTVQPNELDDIIVKHANKTVDMDEVEARLARAFAAAQDPAFRTASSALAELEPLFGARAKGLLSPWRHELQPQSVLASSHRTLHTLLSWEIGAPEHARVVRAIAGLVPRALQMGDPQTALALADELAAEASSTAEEIWRSANARAILNEMDKSALTQLVGACVQSPDRRDSRLPAALIEVVPELALNLLDLLGAQGIGALNAALKQALLHLGDTAVTALERCLRDGPMNARENALELLVDLRGASSADSVAAALDGAEVSLRIRALQLLPRMKTQSATEMCIRALADSVLGVRCVALSVLGELSDEGSLERLVQVATKRGLNNEDVAERIAAIQALGRTGRREALDCLSGLVRHRPLLGGSRYEPIRAVAQKVESELRASLESKSRAA